jgi:hypothetical protein
MIRTIQKLLALLLPTALLALSSPISLSSSNSKNGNAFSLSDYQKARGLETAKCLDASRLHFQIMFVDDDNAKGRIAEGLLARVAEYNDAMFMLFPASSTIEASINAPRDAAAPVQAVAVSESLGLCSHRSTLVGTSFDLSYLDEYDLVIPMNDNIRSLILRSLSASDQEYYGPKCRLLSEFLSPEFCSVNRSKSIGSTSVAQTINNHRNDNDDGVQQTRETSNAKILIDMLDSELQDRVAPFSDLVIDRSSNVLDEHQLELQTAALILAASGVTKFCLETMQAQFESSFQSLLQHNFHSPEHLEVSRDQADAQLRRGSHSVTGYFSPEERRTRFEQHIADLRIKLDDSLP